MNTRVLLAPLALFIPQPFLSACAPAHKPPPTHPSYMLSQQEQLDQALFLSAGANPNAPIGPNAQTALHAASAAGHDGVIRQLLAAGADPNIHDQQGNTPLHLAASRGHNTCCKVLVGTPLDKVRADPNAKNADNDTPLHLAVRNHAEGITLLLTQAGADLDAANNAGQTPRSLAAPR